MAVAYGARKVLSEAAATFQVRPSGKPIKKEITVPPVNVGKYFRLPRGKGLKGPDLYIQKERMRIITPGEKREISYKGIAARTGKVQPSGLKMSPPSFKPKKKPTNFLRSRIKTNKGDRWVLY